MAHVNRLANTNILVFGGTSGIGFAVANMALSYGARVTISGSGQAKVDSKVEQLRSFYPNAASSQIAGFACDLRDQDHLEKKLKDLFEKATHGGKNKIDHIAFTAGGSVTPLTVSKATPEKVLDVFAVRFLAPAIIAKLLTTGEYMSTSADSSFTVTSGTNSHRPMPNWTYMAAAGGAVEGLMHGLAVDLAPIRVNVVSPGAIQTELLQGYLDSLTPEGLKKMKKGGSLLGALGQPEDIAEAYGWIMRDRFATGALVTSDGGRLLVGTES